MFTATGSDVPAVGLHNPESGSSEWELEELRLELAKPPTTSGLSSLLSWVVSRAPMLRRLRSVCLTHALTLHLYLLECMDAADLADYVRGPWTHHAPPSCSVCLDLPGPLGALNGASLAGIVGVASDQGPPGLGGPEVWRCPPVLPVVGGMQQHTHAGEH